MVQHYEVLTSSPDLQHKFRVRFRKDCEILPLILRINSPHT
jgi:hypothetical protein